MGPAHRARPVLALDIGGTKVAGAVVHADGTLAHRFEVPTHAADGPERLLAMVIAQSRALHARAADAVAIGIGSAGQIDYESGCVVYANENLPGWTGMALGPRVSAALGLPVSVDNDVNVMALGEAGYGSAAGRRVVVVVSVGTGIGGALVFDGHLFRGASGVAGEVGHTTVNARGPRCACGLRGCLEAYTSGPRIAAAYASAAGLAEVPDLRRVLALARGGDLIARAAIDQAGRRLGTAMAGLVNLLNPDALLVGGGVSEAGELLLAPLRRQIARRAQGPAAAAVAVMAARLGAAGPLLGAALLASPPSHT